MTDKKVINFNVNDSRIAEVAEEFKQIDAYQDIDEAKAAKKVLTKMRTTLATAHKEQKAESLAYGRTLDAEKNRLLELIAEVEDPITEQLNEIKNAAAKKEAERVDKIAASLDEIRAHSSDRYELDLANLRIRIESLEAYEITEEVFQESLETAQAYQQEGLIKLRNSLQAAEARAAEEARLEEQRKEQAAEDERLRKEREEFEAEKKAQRDKEQAEADERRKAEDERLAKEREELEERQREQEEREAAERKEQEEREAEARKLRLAPDSDKLERLATELSELPLPQCESDEANRVLQITVEKISPVVDYIRNEARKMQ